MSRNSNPAFIPGDRIGEKVADAGRSLAALKVSDPEAYAAEIAKGREAGEKVRRLIRGLK